VSFEEHCAIITNFFAHSFVKVLQTGLKICLKNITGVNLETKPWYDIF